MPVFPLEVKIPQNFEPEDLYKARQDQLAKLSVVQLRAVCDDPERAVAYPAAAEQTELVALLIQFRDKKARERRRRKLFEAGNKADKDDDTDVL